MAPPSRTVRESVISDFHKIISRFSLEELKNSVPPAFEDPALTWALIKKALVKYNLSATKRDIALLLLEYVTPLETDEIQQIYGNLTLLDLMFHSGKKTWTSVSMLQENQIPADDEVVENIMRKFLEKRIRLMIHSDVSGDIRWFTLLIKQKKRNNETPLKKPIFIARPLSTSYIFVTPPRTSPDLLKIIVQGLGYDNLKVLKLNGKSIPSLISMLDRRKDADQLRARTSLALRNVNYNVGVKSSKGIDFCQDQVRSEQAEEILGKEHIQLEKLVVKANTEWRGLRTVPEAEGKRLNLSMKLSSKDVHSSLKELIKAGAILPPYPGWLKEFSISGKNVLEIR